MLVSKSFSIVGRATLIAEKSLAITTTAIPIAKRASQLMRCGAEASMRGSLRKAADAARGLRYPARERMTHRFHSLALLLLLPPRGE